MSSIYLGGRAVTSAKLGSTFSYSFSANSVAVNTWVDVTNSSITLNCKGGLVDLFLRPYVGVDWSATSPVQTPYAFARSGSGNGNFSIRVLRDSTVIFRRAAFASSGEPDTNYSLNFLDCVDYGATEGPHTYKIQVSAQESNTSSLVIAYSAFEARER